MILANFHLQNYFRNFWGDYLLCCLFRLRWYWAIVERSWRPGKPIRLLAFTAINLTGESDGGQISLFDDLSDEIRQEKLELLMDNLTRRL